MITTTGKQHLKRYMGEQVRTVAEGIAFGLGNRAESASDSALQFEFGRVEINLVSYDFVNNRIVYKATLPSTVAGTIYEVGLWSLMENSLASAYGSRVLTTFDANSEFWSAGTFIAGGRIGDDSLRLQPAASATVTSQMDNVNFDFDQNSNSDTFILAFNNANTNAASVEIRFLNDSSNYFTYTVTNPVAGYNIITFPKGSVTGVGVPDWEQINGLQFNVVAKAAGVATIDLDGLRIEDVDTVNPDYVLISRRLVTPYTKVAGRVEEIEFALPVNIS